MGFRNLFVRFLVLKRAEHVRRLWRPEAEEGEVLKDPLNLQGDWEGLGQVRQIGKVKEKHSTVSSESQGQEAVHSA